MKTHRQLYPAQYSHPLCGKTVRRTRGDDRSTFVVERVLQTRFGPLVPIPDVNPMVAVAAADLEVVVE